MSEEQPSEVHHHHYNFRPIQVELTRKNEELVHAITGLTISQIKERHREKGLPLRRFSSKRGATYVLRIDDFDNWSRKLPQEG